MRAIFWLKSLERSRYDAIVAAPIAWRAYKNSLESLLRPRVVKVMIAEKKTKFGRRVRI